MKYDKLVRDRIPEIIARRGAKAITRVADDAEYWLKLRTKLQEEVGEFLEAENMEELADILEVIHAICRHKGFDKAALRELRRKKAEERGGFDAKIILEEA
jgi:predicted house-cleaning noncanonical NTP pyrophosphatase (MazG superfamily)